MKAVLFDCDGTLADSFGTICEIMREAFVHHALEAPPRDEIKAIIGLSLDVAFLRLVPMASEAFAGEMAETYRAIFRARRQGGSLEEPLFDGMKDLVEMLAVRDDVLLGIVTGKSRRGVDAICKANGLGGRFLAVRTADDCPSKPHPAMVEECCAELGLDPADALVIGDSVYDMEMAKAAGAKAIGVSWGSFPADTLLLAGASRVAETPQGLRRMIDDWLGAKPGSGPLSEEGWRP